MATYNNLINSKIAISENTTYFWELQENQEVLDHCDVHVGHCCVNFQLRDKQASIHYCQ